MIAAAIFNLAWLGLRTQQRPPCDHPPMNLPLAPLALCQGLFLTNNAVFIAINGLVCMALAPVAWMVALPVAGYVVGGAIPAPKKSLPA